MSPRYGTRSPPRSPVVRSVDIVIAADAADVDLAAADLVTGAVVADAEAVLGLATGSSPLGLYAELGRRVATGGLDTSRVRGFALDEYVGLAAGDPRSYAHYVHARITVPLGLDPRRVRVPVGVGADVEAACHEYEEAIARAGGVDLQILGVGRNGHLGFNEPGAAFDSRTRIAPLSESTRRDNARFFDRLEDVPTHCVTQGLGTIMQARSALLIATGPAKADAVAALVEGPVDTSCPASILQRHPRVTVICDRAAGQRLSRTRTRSAHRVH
jgi:glucosamine-6-phosphate deaminase